MSKELLLIVDAVAHEKAVPRQSIFQALESALAGAKRKQLAPEDAFIRVRINQDDGSYRAWRCWEVIGNDAVMDDPARQIRMMDALDEIEGAVEVGDVIEHEVDPPQLGRVAAQTVKQILVQRVRESEREIARAQWSNRIGEMVLGTVKRFEKGQVYLDLGSAEAVIPRNLMIPGEKLRVGHRVRGVLVEIDAQAKGPQLKVSRIDPLLMTELFALEVPEVGQGVIEIKACARDAGQRAKIAVVSHDKRLDPIGACIGMRGSRVQAISNELNGERVDIVLWDENPAQFLVNAMAPAQIEKMVLNEEKQSADLGVDGQKLAMAIGRAGQNIRLASRLTGWSLNVMSLEDLDAKATAEFEQVVEDFTRDLDVDREIAVLLAEEGFTTLDEIAYVSSAELLAIDGFDEEIVDELRSRATDALVVRELRVEEAEVESGDLDDVEGISPQIREALFHIGVSNREALAELSVDELAGVGGLDEGDAGKLIMQARAPWFA